MRYEKEFKDCTNSSVFKKIYRRKECRNTGRCDRCPWHGGENAGIGRKPKDDVYKNKNRDTIRRYNQDDCYFFKG